MTQGTRVAKRQNSNELKQATANSGMLKIIRNQVKSTLGRIQNGSITVTDPVETYVCGEQQTDVAVTLTIRDLDFYRQVALEGSNGAAQSYIDNKWDVDNLTGLVQILVRNIELLDEMEGGLAWLRNSALKVWHYFNKNSVSGSKDNISAHYDLGNEFFKLFLDKHMMYSSAIFAENESLEVASERKLKTICDKLDLKPTDKVIEIGTGWGGMAIYAAKNYGCHVTTTTISEQQYQYAKQRISEEGLENVFKRHHRLAEGVRNAVKGWGLKLCAKEKKWESDTVTAIYVPEEFDSANVIKTAYLKYNLALGAGLSDVAGKVFRIGHLGDLNELMCLGAISGAEMAMRDVGIDIKPGSGIAAAEEYYRKTAPALPND